MDTEKYFLSLRNRLFRSPNIIVSLGTVLVILVIYEIFAHINIKDFILLFIGPYFLLIGLDALFFKITKQYFPWERLFLLEEIVFIFVFIVYLIFLIIFSEKFVVSLLLSLSLSTFLRYMFLKPFLNVNEKTLTIFSLNYVFSLTIMYIFTGYSLFYLIPFYISSILFYYSSRFFIYYLSREFRMEYNLDPVKYVGYFINYLSQRSTDDLLSLNNFLKVMYSVKELPIQVIALRKKNNELKGLLIFPYIHPGPFGEVGCSNLPYRIAKKLEPVSKNVMVFHTSSTHDENCSGEEDIEKIVKTIKESLNIMKFYDTGTDVSRYVDKINFRYQVLGDTLMLTLLPINNGFDDVSLEEGMKVMRKMKSSNIRNVVIIDAHNNFHINYRILKEIDQNSLKKIKENLKDMKRVKIAAGFSNHKYESGSVGPLGIQTLVLKTNRTYAYVLLDGNNVVLGLREKILKSLDGIVDDLEIYTTDNHIVNMDPKDLNPIGNKDDENILIENIRESLFEAIKDMEEVQIGTHTTRVLVKVGGKGYVEKVSEIVGRMVKRLRVSILIVILSFIFSILIFYFSFRIIH
ncbi:MAG: DUF2070 family protein [Thermoplasmata archaeon]